MVGEVSIPVSVRGRTKRQKVSMDIIITETLVCARIDMNTLVSHLANRGGYELGIIPSSVYRCEKSEASRAYIDTKTTN